MSANNPYEDLNELQREILKQTGIPAEYIKSCYEEAGPPPVNPQTSPHNSLKILSTELLVKPTDTCTGCGCSFLKDQTTIYNYQSRKFVGAWVLGCYSCWMSDRNGQTYKEYFKSANCDQPKHSELIRFERTH